MFFFLSCISPIIYGNTTCESFFICIQLPPLHCTTWCFPSTSFITLFLFLFLFVFTYVSYFQFSTIFLIFPLISLPSFDDIISIVLDDLVISLSIPSVLTIRMMLFLSFAFEIVSEYVFHLCPWISIYLTYIYFELMMQFFPFLLCLILISTFQPPAIFYSKIPLIIFSFLFYFYHILPFCSDTFFLILVP